MLPFAALPLAAAVALLPRLSRAYQPVGCLPSLSTGAFWSDQAPAPGACATVCETKASGLSVQAKFFAWNADQSCRCFDRDFSIAEVQSAGSTAGNLCSEDGSGLYMTDSAAGFAFTACVTPFSNNYWHYPFPFAAEYGLMLPGWCANRLPFRMMRVAGPGVPDPIPGVQQSLLDCAREGLPYAMMTAEGTCDCYSHLSIGATAGSCGPSAMVVYAQDGASVHPDPGAYPSTPAEIGAWLGCPGFSTEPSTEPPSTSTAATVCDKKGNCPPRNPGKGQTKTKEPKPPKETKPLKQPKRWDAQLSERRGARR